MYNNTIRISDSQAMDLLANMFKAPDWGDISIISISEIIEATGRDISEETESDDLECNVCGEVYPSWMYVDVFKKPDDTLICERCVPANE